MGALGWRAWPGDKPKSPGQTDLSHAAGAKRTRGWMTAESTWDQEGPQVPPADLPPGPSKAAKHTWLPAAALFSAPRALQAPPR